jgi:hypothetical protein
MVQGPTKLGMHMGNTLSIPHAAGASWGLWSTKISPYQTGPFYFFSFSFKIVVDFKLSLTFV